MDAWIWTEKSDSRNDMSAAWIQRIDGFQNQYRSMGMTDRTTLKQLHEFYDGLSAGIIFFARDGKETFLFANDRALQLYDCHSEEELTENYGQTAEDLVTSRNYIPLSCLSSGGEASSYLFDCTTKQKTRRLEARITTKMLGETAIYLVELLPARNVSNAFITDELMSLPFGTELPQAVSRYVDELSQKNLLTQYRAVYLEFFVSSGELEETCARMEDFSKSVLESMHDIFPESFVTGIGRKNFMGLLPEKDLPRKLGQLRSRIRASLNLPELQVKAGIVSANKAADKNNLSQLFFAARLLTHSIRYTNTMYIYGSQDAEDFLENRIFIAEHFEDSMEAGNIRVYYQPYVRHLSGKICGYEAVARWEDPSCGVIPPQIFIPALEDAGLIEKLDSYVTENVCRLLHDRIQAGLTVLPVSVNLSQVDFGLKEPLEFLDHITEEYHIPKELLHLEMKEAVLSQDAYSAEKILEVFQERGYRVWLDDYVDTGSTVRPLCGGLFQAVKIDMTNFRSLSQTDRRSIQTIIRVLKSAGIVAIAEGVETKDECDFLAASGIDRMQGNYFLQPMMFEDCQSACLKRGLSFETAQENAMYSKGEKLNLLSEQPLAVFIGNGDSVRLLAANPAYLSSFLMTGAPTVETVNNDLKSGLFPAGGKIMRFLREASDGKHRSITYIDNGEYVRMTAWRIAGSEKQWLAGSTIINLSTETEFRQNSRLDAIARTLLHLYDTLLYFNQSMGSVQVIESTIPAFVSGQIYENSLETVRQKMRYVLHPDDTDRFDAFLNTDAIYRSAEASGRAESADMFRIKGADGNYHWIVFRAIILYKTPDKDFILCEQEEVWQKLAAPERKALLPAFYNTFGLAAGEGAERENGIYSGIVKAMQHMQPQKFFWKDRERRLLGASDSFYAFFHETPDNLVGTTSENAAMYIETIRAKADEERVLKGKTVRSIRTCNIDGLPVTVSVVQFPYYVGNQIAGIAGILTDETRNQKTGEHTEGAMLFLDPETGFLNMAGVITEFVSFDDRLRKFHEDYVALVLEVKDFENLLRVYGSDFGREMVALMTGAIRHQKLEDIVVGHTKGCRFFFFGRSEKLDLLDADAADIRKSMESIREVAGFPVTPKLTESRVFGGEGGTLQSVVSLLGQRIFSGQQSETLAGQHILVPLTAVEQASEPVYLIDPRTLDLLYLNKGAKEDLGLPVDFNCAGTKCYEVLYGRTKQCRFCGMGTLQPNEVHTWTRRSRRGSKLNMFHEILVPWRDRAAAFVLSMSITDYIQIGNENQVLYREASVNEAIEAAVREENPDTGIQLMLNRIAGTFEAQRCLIFEEDGNVLRCTYEWCEEGVVPLKDELRSVIRERVAPLYRMFQTNPVIRVSDFEQFMEKNPDFRLPISGIDSFIAAQLVTGGHTIGFTMAVNCSGDTLKSAGSVLQTLAGFFTIMIRNRNNRKELENQSVRDHLTGTLNRRGLDQFLQAYNGQADSNKDVCTVISADINGLKATNDSKGHTAGDMLIRTAARVMIHALDENHVFRMGGDEFLLIAEHCSEEAGKQLMKKIRIEARAQNVSMAMGQVVHEGAITDIDALMHAADQRMYEDKDHAYETGEVKAARRVSQFEPYTPRQD